MANNPIVNARVKYCNGLNISWASATTIGVAAGACSNSDNVNDIVLSSAVVINGAANSAVNRLDSGSLANNTLYAVYAIADSTGYATAGALLSLASNSAPSLPYEYDMYRRIGYVRTDGSAQFLAFDQRGDGLMRAMWYRASIATDITSGSSATFAAVDVSGSIPAGGKVGIFKVTFTPTGADDPCELRCGDSSTDNGQAILSGSAAGVVKIGNLECPIGAALASGVDYKVTGSAVAINVQGYYDVLA